MICNACDMASLSSIKRNIYKPSNMFAPNYFRPQKIYMFPRNTVFYLSTSPIRCTISPSVTCVQEEGEQRLRGSDQPVVFRHLSRLHAHTAVRQNNHRTGRGRGIPRQTKKVRTADKDRQRDRHRKTKKQQDKELKDRDRDRQRNKDRETHKTAT